MYLLLIASILFASLNSILLHTVRLRSSTSVYRLNLIGALVWLFCLLALNGFRIALSPSVLLFGVLYGLTQALFILFKSLAMNRGPVSVTSLLGNGSLLLSVAVCYFAFGEAVTLGDALGLAALVLAILLTTYTRGGASAPRKRGWLISALLFLILGAGVGILFKAFARSGSSAAAGDMMCVAAAVMVVSLLPLLLIARKREGVQEGEGRRYFVIALLSGLLSCLYNRLNITLSGGLDAIIFFPFFNGGVIFVTTVCSVLFTKERLRMRQIIGLLLGIASIAVIGVL